MGLCRVEQGQSSFRADLCAPCIAHTRVVTRMAKAGASRGGSRLHFSQILCCAQRLAYAEGILCSSAESRTRHTNSPTQGLLRGCRCQHRPGIRQQSGRAACLL